MVDSKDKGLPLMGLSDYEREWSNAEELEYLKDRLKVEQDIYNKKYKKIKIGGYSFVSFTAIFVVVSIILGITKSEYSSLIFSLDSGYIPVCLLANFLIDKLDDKACAKVKSLRSSIEKCEEEIEEEKKLELEKKISAFDFEKKYDELSKDDYIAGMKRYYNNLVELAKKDPELAKELAEKAFKEQGLVDAGIISENDEKDSLKYEDSNNIKGTSYKKNRR